MATAIFPGSFDPFTIGHYSVVKRALAFVDEVIISIGVNEAKKTLFSLDRNRIMVSVQQILHWIYFRFVS